MRKILLLISFRIIAVKEKPMKSGKTRALCIMVLIFMPSIIESGEVPIAAYKYDQEMPAIYGDIVVWHDWRNSHENRRLV